MRRIHLVLAVVLTLFALPSIAQDHKPLTREGLYDWMCFDADGKMLSGHQRFDTADSACRNNPLGAYVQAAKYKLNRTVTPPPPTCGPAPAVQEQVATCPTGQTGSWPQTMSHVQAAYPTCWTPGAWVPAEPPAGACVTPEPVVALRAPVVSLALEPNETNAGRFNIIVSWTNVNPTATKYVIWRCSGANCTSFGALAEVTGDKLTYSNTNVPGGFTYKYRVRPHRDAEVGPASEPVSIVTQAAPPPDATGTATLQWTPPVENSAGPLAGYKVLYSKDFETYNQSLEIPNAGLSQYTISNLAPGTYYFKMKSYTSTGAESSDSNSATKTVN